MQRRAYRHAFLALLAVWCSALDAQPPAGTGGEQPAAAPPVEDDGPWFVEHDCQLCHQLEQRTIGPAYRDIASRYPGADGATLDELATRVIEGSTGRWGDMPMTPHADLGKDQARAMVQRILSLTNAR
jgi:cytochrome c